MADLKDKFADNVEGEFYVDESCITCGQCMKKAPYNFKFTVGDKHAIVSKQPETAEEKKLCVEALESCPVDAIGFDGA